LLLLFLNQIDSFLLLIFFLFDILIKYILTLFDLLLMFYLYIHLNILNLIHDLFSSLFALQIMILLFLGGILDSLHPTLFHDLIQVQIAFFGLLILNLFSFDLEVSFMIAQSLFNHLIHNQSFSLVFNIKILSMLQDLFPLLFQELICAKLLF
jgi:hypothetical protein